MYDELGHYETFGHAYLVQNGVCASFLDRHHQVKTICGVSVYSPEVTAMEI